MTATRPPGRSAPGEQPPASAVRLRLLAATVALAAGVAALLVAILLLRSVLA